MPLQPLSMLYFAKPARTERAALYAPFAVSGWLVPGECRSGKTPKAPSRQPQSSLTCASYPPLHGPAEAGPVHHRTVASSMRVPHSTPDQHATALRASARQHAGLRRLVSTLRPFGLACQQRFALLGLAVSLSSCGPTLPLSRAGAEGRWVPELAIPLRDDWLKATVGSVPTSDSLQAGAC